MNNPLTTFNSWLDHRDGVTPEDIVRRVVERTCKTTIHSLGHKWDRFMNLYTELGPLEFEVFIQANIDAKLETIKDRGFYPSILLEQDALDIFIQNREAILNTWSHPAKRYRSPMFTSIFPNELALAEEFIARLSKGNVFIQDPEQGMAVNKLSETSFDRGPINNILKDVYDQSVAQVRDTGSGFWLMTEYSLEELQNYYSSETPQWKLIKRDRVILVGGVAERRLLRREKWRAQVETCVTVVRRYLGDRHDLVESFSFDPTPHFELGEDPKIVNLRNPNPLLIEVGCRLITICPPPKSNGFKINDNGKAM